MPIFAYPERVIMGVLLNFANFLILFLRVRAIFRFLGRLLTRLVLSQVVFEERKAILWITASWMALKLSSGPSMN